MTLTDFKNQIKKTPFSEIRHCDIIAYQRLIHFLEMYDNSSFGNSSLKEIESEHPYFLLELSRPSVAAFLLYKKLIEKYK